MMRLRNARQGSMGGYRQRRVLSQLAASALLGAVSAVAAAQSIAVAATAVPDIGSRGPLPDAPESQTQPQPPPPAVLSGTVEDSTGTVIPGATVTLSSGPPSGNQVLVTNGSGFFSVANLTAGTYRLVVAAPGFLSSTQANISVVVGKDLFLPKIVLQPAIEATSVIVHADQHEVADAQIKEQEKQRAFGIVPFFFVSYVAHPAPLDAKQKFALSLKAATDPVPFVGAALAAGVEQANNTYPGYRQGAQGFAKRYGAAYADGFIGTMLGGALFPSLFHQDPRFFYKADGTTRERALYAASTAFIRKSDRGKWQPNYSGILGNFASGAISNIYYPSTDRGVGTTFRTAGTGIGFGVIAGLLQEFIPRAHVQKVSDPAHP